MSSLHQDKLLKIITNFSPRKSLNFYYPAGSFSSNQHSQETYENYSDKSSNESISNDGTNFLNNSIELISYEPISFYAKNCDKGIQVMNPILLHSNQENLQEKISEMTEIIENLQEKCTNYEKQNESLRKEINSAYKENIENNKNSLKIEIQNLKSKINVHENMIIKILSIAEELCEEEPDISKKISQIDYHAYNYLISKLEIVRYRMSRYTSRIQQLEYEKNSITEMLNCYITTDKIIDTQKIKYSPIDNAISDYRVLGC